MLTAVRNMSRMRSTPKISAIPVAGTPACVNTIVSVMIPALGTPAAPTDARVAVSTTVSCAPTLRSIPNTWAMNMTATPWYNAVPSMLTVAPSGSTKLAILLDTPRFSSAVCMVTGSVALELDVEKPNNCGLRMRLKNSTGLRRAMNLTISENVPMACSSKPNTTVPVYQSRLWRISNPNRAVTAAIITNTAYGASTMIQ